MINLGVISLEHPHAEGMHFPALRYLRDRVRIAGIANNDYERTKEWLYAFSAEFYADRDALLSRDDIDAVLITSKNSDHAKDSIAAARAGKDILCDKPVTTTIEDARAVVAEVKKAGVRFITTFPVRFNTSVRHLKNAVDNGGLGKICAVMATNHGCMYEPGVPGWVKDPISNGGGCIIDHTVHVADVIRWLTGSEFATVKAEATTALHQLPTEDIGVLHGEMDDGAIYQIDASWSRRANDPMWGDVTFRIIGTKGSATLDLYNNHRIEIYKENSFEFKYPNYLLREHGEIFLDYALWKEEGKATIAANEVDGLRTMELVMAAYQSVHENRRVDIKKYV